MPEQSLPPVARREVVGQHLVHRVPEPSEHPRSLLNVHPIYHHRRGNPPIEIHATEQPSVNDYPPALNNSLPPAFGGSDGKLFAFFGDGWAVSTSGARSLSSVRNR